MVRSPLRGEPQLVGRQRELKRFDKLWADGAQTICLVGPPGVGKTRLARELALKAGRLEGLSSNRVFFCELSDVTALDELVGRVADSVDVPPEMRRKDALQGLLDWLAEGPPGLIFLDNVEQIASETIVLLEKLQAAAAQVRMVVTSRITLGVGMEMVLQPLDVASANGNQGQSDFAKSPACKLFAEFAGLNEELDDRTAHTVASIVQRLDGLPLSIQLAAGRLDTLSLAELDRRLEHKFRVLREGWPGSPAHHRNTLWNTLDWSWQMLSDTQRSVLGQLSVFQGRFSEALASEICGLEGEKPIEVVLQSLMRHNLVMKRKPSQGGEYQLLPTIQEFVIDRWAPSPEDKQELWRRFSNVLARRAIALRDGVSQAESHRSSVDGLLDMEPNLLAVIHGKDGWPVPSPIAAGQASFALVRALTARGDWKRALRLLETALQPLEELETPEAYRIRGQLLRTKSLLLGWMGRNKEKLPAALEAARVSELDGIWWARGYAWLQVGGAYQRLGELDEAERYTLKALEIIQGHEESENIRGIALGTLAYLAEERGEMQTARGRLEELVALYDQTSIGQMQANSRNMLGYQLLLTGHPDDAEEVLVEALEIARELEDSQRTLMATTLLGWVKLERGELEPNNLDELIEGYRARGAHQHETTALTMKVVTLLSRGQVQQCRRLLPDTIPGSESFGWGEVCLALKAALQAASDEQEQASEHLNVVRERMADRPDTVLVAYARAFSEVCSLLLAREKGAGEIPGVESVVSGISSRTVVEGIRHLVEFATGNAISWKFAEDASWFQPPDGERIDLSQHEAPRKILLALLESRQKGESGLTRQTLFQVGWPGEEIQESAAANRVYVALSTLRKFGLGDAIVNRDGRYQLDLRHRVEPVD